MLSSFHRRTLKWISLWLSGVPTTRKMGIHASTTYIQRK